MRLIYNWDEKLRRFEVYKAFLPSQNHCKLSDYYYNKNFEGYTDTPEDIILFAAEFTKDASYSFLPYFVDNGPIIRLFIYSYKIESIFHHENIYYHKNAICIEI